MKSTACRMGVHRADRGPKKAPSAQRLTKSDLKRSWRPLWAHMAPRGAPEASRPSFGALRAPSGSICCFIFDDFSTFVSHSFPVMFLFVFAWVLVFALFFEGFEALTLKFLTPRSLKPWVAAGGREAIWIKITKCS